MKTDISALGSYRADSQSGGWVKTYESERIYKQSADGVSEHPHAEYLHVGKGDEEIPQEISCCQSLNHGRSTRIPIDTFLGVHFPALLIREHNPQRQHIDHAALHEGHNMNIPVHLSVLGQGIVLNRHQVI